MNNKFLFFFLSVFLIIACDDEKAAGPGDADTYIKFFGAEFSDIAYMLQQTPDGGCVLLGTTELEDSDGNDVFKIKVIKVDNNGNQIWEKIYPDYLPDQSDYATSFIGRSIIVVDDGYIVVGDSIKSDQSTKSSLLVMKLNDSETDDTPPTLAIDHMDNTQSDLESELHGIDVIQDSDGNYRVISNTIDIEGKLGSWFNTINASNFSFDPINDCFYDSERAVDMVKSLHETSAGQFVYGGSDRILDKDNAILFEVPSCQNSPSGGSSLLVSNPQDDYTANQIIATKTGYAMIGTRTSVTGTDIFFSLLGANGVPTGNVKFFEDPGNGSQPGIGANDEEGLTIANTSDGGFIIGGFTLSGSVGEEDILLIKTDALGNVKWSKIHGNVNQEQATHVQQAADGGYLVFGNTEFGGIDTMFLMKTDKNGDVH